MNSQISYLRRVSYCDEPSLINQLAYINTCIHCFIGLNGSGLHRMHICSSQCFGLNNSNIIHATEVVSYLDVLEMLLLVDNKTGSLLCLDIEYLIKAH